MEIIAHALNMSVEDILFSLPIRDGNINVYVRTHCR